jgi:dynein assembly factor 5
MPKLIEELQQTSNLWNENSYDRLVFQTLIIESDLIVDKYIDKIISILEDNLNVIKDAETRTKFLILISQITLKCDQTNTNNFINYIETILNKMVIPNLIWKAGRVANAIRMTATATLLTILNANFFKKIQVSYC